MSSKYQIWRPYTQEKTAPSSHRITRAEGAYLYTAVGERIFDGVSSWWLTTHGHCHPYIVAAVQKQATLIDQVLFANFTHEPAEELAELLAQLMPRALNHVFYSDNGSTAVEVALKMALQACRQSGAAKKTRFLAFQGAYHGDTVGAMSVSARGTFVRPYQTNLFDVIRAAHPLSSAAATEEYVRDFQRLIEEHHEHLAGVIMEPLIQAAGGMIFWPALAVQKISQLCRDFGVYLIFDEVMTGFGRTGSMFAFESVGVVPDFVCLSKGLTGGTLPLAVTLTTNDIYQAFLSEDGNRRLFHGHSFTGNPISCAAAVANVQVFSNEKTLARLGPIMRAQQSALAKLQAQIPVVEPRVCGTVAAFEVDSGERGYANSLSSRLTHAAFRKGVFVRPLGSTIYLMPPYCTRPEEIAEAWEVIGEALAVLL